MGLINRDGFIARFLFGKNNFFTTNSVMIGQKGAVYIDVEKPYDLYHSIPQLKTIIGKKKAMFANVIPCIKDKNGNEIKNALSEQLLQLIYNPNCSQDMNSFLMNQLEQYDVYGNQFTYKNKPSSLTSFPVALWNISPRYLTPELSGKVFDQLSMDDLVKYYKYEDDTTKKQYKTNEILWLRENDLDNPVIGTSKLKFLKHPLSNIDGAYKFRNVIINEKGALGILSNSSKDSMGAIPLSPEEKKRIENQHRASYGINEGQMRMLITEAQLSWTPMSYPTKDLMLFEEVHEDTLVLIDHFGMNVHLFANTNSTFENVKNAIKQVYSDTIQPYADSYFQSISKFLEIEKLFGKGAYICPSYEHIKVLQDDKKEGAERFKLNVESVSQLVTTGIITPQQGQSILSEMSGLVI